MRNKKPDLQLQAGLLLTNVITYLHTDVNLVIKNIHPLRIFRKKAHLSRLTCFFLVQIPSVAFGLVIPVNKIKQKCHQNNCSRDTY